MAEQGTDEKTRVTQGDVVKANGRDEGENEAESASESDPFIDLPGYTPSHRLRSTSVSDTS